MQYKLPGVGYAGADIGTRRLALGLTGEVSERVQVHSSPGTQQEGK